MSQKYSMTEKEMSEEIYLIKSFPAWPHYPVCPMINRIKRAPDGLPEVGFLLATDVMVKKAVVYHENFTNLGKLKDMGIITDRDFDKKIKKTEYNSFEEMVNNGWKAD